MIQAFYTGISGLRTNQTAIDAVSDNIANVSTVGYRGYNVEFSSLFEESINTQSASSSVDSSIGVGSKVNATVMNEDNGSLILSDKSTDLAINGDGWFSVQGEGNPLYTRNGTFTFDVNGDLVTTDGLHVLGTLGNNISNGILSPQLDEINLSDVSTQKNLNFPKTLTFPSISTTKASFSANLGIDNVTRSVSAGVIDGQGVKNDLRLEFKKSATQTSPGVQWDVVATTKSLDGTTLYDTQSGKVSFDASGGLLSSTLSSIDNNGTSVAIDLGTEYAGIVATSGSVFAGSSSTDGKQAGNLLGYDINSNAEVVATFSNGEQSSVGKIALFHFQNDKGLERISGSRFRESANSGEPIFYKNTAGKNILGASVQNFKLENSNVKLEAGLTDLIIHQRAYDANSKSITTADQMMQKALNMDA